ncbi:hypothetical protein O9K51_05032 [Purpureocillium lavendulum]|uniref:Uncharacterized protein n=1 Tax=Purpureocillium lavendulum TaxID=1247861 RepID=A0AB34FRN9_9HYPO|nr:hypothetical protein O9K51_05032 [Purpureocillium lavendulum]
MRGKVRDRLDGWFGWIDHRERNITAEEHVAQEQRDSISNEQRECHGRLGCLSSIFAYSGYRLSTWPQSRCQNL